MYIAPPNYTLNSLIVDSELNYLAEYIKTKVNQAYNNNDLIKTYRTFNDIAIPLTDFPCLKIYRVSDTLFSEYSTLIKSTLTLSYITSFTSNKNIIFDTHDAVAKEITRVLINASSDPSFLLQLDFSNGYPSTTFDTFINPSNTIYKYATLNVSIYSDFRSLESNIL